MHRDSVGSEQSIRPGEVNWMTSGRGITHSARFEELRANGGPMDGIQAWVALPNEREETDPGFWHYPSQALPVFDGDGIAGRDRKSNVCTPVTHGHTVCRLLLDK